MKTTFHTNMEPVRVLQSTYIYYNKKHYFYKRKKSKILYYSNKTNIKKIEALYECLCHCRAVQRERATRSAGAGDAGAGGRAAARRRALPQPHAAAHAASAQRYGRNHFLICVIHTSSDRTFIILLQLHFE